MWNKIFFMVNIGKPNVEGVTTLLAESRLLTTNNKFYFVDSNVKDLAKPKPANLSYQLSKALLFILMVVVKLNHRDIWISQTDYGEDRRRKAIRFYHTKKTEKGISSPSHCKSLSMISTNKSFEKMSNAIRYLPILRCLNYYVTRTETKHIQNLILYTLHDIHFTDLHFITLFEYNFQVKIC